MLGKHGTDKIEFAKRISESKWVKTIKIQEIYRAKQIQETYTTKTHTKKEKRQNKYVLVLQHGKCANKHKYTLKTSYSDITLYRHQSKTKAVNESGTKV